MVAQVSNSPLPLSADPWLRPYAGALERRRAHFAAVRQRLESGGAASLADFASAHEYYGLHRRNGRWIFREWAPHATGLTLVGDFSAWRCEPRFALRRLNAEGDWEITLDDAVLKHAMHYLLRIEWPGGEGMRVPAYARYVVQDPATKLFAATVWQPAEPYRFRRAVPPAPAAPLIYEAHVGMGQEEPKVGSFTEFRENVLPRIAGSGYNTVQLMAVMNHPYYGSFGYHVASFFSIADRFGTPDEFKELIDAAHGLGLRVIIDLIHSHAVRNEVEGLARFDGSRSTYFHAGPRGEHHAWDSLCFDYGKDKVLHFLLSNCRFWLDEYRVDGFRFDGVTSMLYFHHGLGKCFTCYGDYFGAEVDEDALTYLALANEVIHQVRPDAITVAEDVSGLPGLAAPRSDGGCGFDFRLAMGVTDMWFKLFDIPDENWSVAMIFYELVNRRRDEKTISYVECHDQSIVGGQTAIFRLAGAAMYDAMRRDIPNFAVERACALHKVIRLATLAAAGHGYLNFMGNEFGHPEWVDFPREGNGWSNFYARRQWSLAADSRLRYHDLGEFDRALLALIGGETGFFDRPVQLVRLDELAKILIFERNGLWFCFNFHFERSAPDYAFEAMPGEYQLVLDSDEVRFGGYGRLTPEEVHRTAPEGNGGGTRQALRVYLPSRSAQVLRRLGALEKHAET